MAAIIQHKAQQNASGTTAPITLTGAPVQGHYLIAFVWSVGATAQSIASGWTAIDGPTGANSRESCTCYKICGSGESATQTPVNLSPAEVNAVEMYEIDPQGVLLIDDHSLAAMASLGSGVAQSVTVNPANSGDLILGFSGASTTTNTFTGPTGYTTDDSLTAATPEIAGVHLSNAASGSQTLNFTWTGGSAFVSSAAVALSSLVVPPFFDITRAARRTDGWYNTIGLNPATFKPESYLKAWVTPDIVRAGRRTDGWFSALGVLSTTFAPENYLKTWVTPDVRSSGRYHPEAFFAVRGVQATTFNPEAYLKAWVTPDIQRPYRQKEGWSVAQPTLDKDHLPLIVASYVADVQRIPPLIHKWGAFQPPLDNDHLPLIVASFVPDVRANPKQIDKWSVSQPPLDPDHLPLIVASFVPDLPRTRQNFNDVQPWNAIYIPPPPPVVGGQLVPFVEDFRRPFRLTHAWYFALVGVPILNPPPPNTLTASPAALTFYQGDPPQTVQVSGGQAPYVLFTPPDFNIILASVDPQSGHAIVSVRPNSDTALLYLQNVNSIWPGEIQSLQTTMVVTDGSGRIVTIPITVSPRQTRAQGRGFAWG